MDDKELKAYNKAGEIASEVLSHGAKMIKPGVKCLEVAEKIESRVRDEFKAEMAFPTNISVNDVAAHYTPKHDDNFEFSEDQVVKLDVGVHVDGYIADTATTVDLTGEYGKMLEANELALEEAIKVVEPGVSVRKIGETVQSILNKAGFKPVENLTGHELKQYDLHAGLSVPNIKVPYEWTLEEGMALAFEPFATDGAGHVIESTTAEIYSLLDEKPTRMREARMLLKAVREREALPFAARWYAGKINPMKLNLVLNQLTQAEILKAYTPLHDRGKGMVSQYEHTLVVTDDGCVVTTK
ncbi:MAG: type II methionyl aminopeptidase [Candidatus Altiarchaeales archaeon]|nr:type II methionyl aminopeptidase [Candidatus Altiarchaeales archaeon]MBD3416942.1 type II methionyl aminopeptidase [Candidatus Altiarchaeales archaeon]